MRDRGAVGVSRKQIKKKENEVKKMKKILAMVVAMVMVLGMVGCGKSESGSKPSKDVPSNAEVIVSTQNTNESTESKPKDDEDIVRVEEIPFEVVGEDGPQTLQSELMGEYMVNANKSGVAYFYEYKDGTIEPEVIYND